MSWLVSKEGKKGVWDKPTVQSLKQNRMVAFSSCSNSKSSSGAGCQVFQFGARAAPADHCGQPRHPPLAVQAAGGPGPELCLRHPGGTQRGGAQQFRGKERIEKRLASGEREKERKASEQALREGEEQRQTVLQGVGR